MIEGLCWGLWGAGVRLRGGGLRWFPALGIGIGEATYGGLWQ